MPLNHQLTKFITLFMLMVAVLYPMQAKAIPSFAAQTNQPCSACHVGAYGPQLTPYGRDFKLGGYSSSDRPNNNLVDNWRERITTAAWTSFNSSSKDMPPSPGGVGYGPNNNFSLDQIAVYYGGKLAQNAGGIAEFTYDGANRNFTWDAMDFRYSKDTELFGEDLTAGLELGNQLGNTSVWNSTPPNGFPYNKSRILPTPAANTLIDGSLNAQILGPGAYFLWNDLVYAETAVYFPLSNAFDTAVGAPIGDKYVSPIPYWHIALQKLYDHHEQYAQIGMFGAVADVKPGYVATGKTDHYGDLAFEANYQYLADSHNTWSAHALFEHEHQTLDSSFLQGNSSNRVNKLNKFSVDVTRSINDTYVPTVQYFKTFGTRDDGLYAAPNFGNSRPNSEGFTFDLAYVPFGKPDSSFYWGNMRLALQYTAYTQYNGDKKNASDNNALFLNLIVHIAPFAAFESHDK